MIYAVLVGLILLSSALALWFRHKYGDAAEIIKRLDKAIVRLGEILDSERKAKAGDLARLEAVIRGHKMEVLRLEKALHAALITDPVHAGEYVRSQLSQVPEDADTTAYSIVPDPAGTRGSGSKRGGSS